MGKMKNSVGSHLLKMDRLLLGISLLRQHPGLAYEVEEQEALRLREGPLPAWEEGRPRVGFSTVPPATTSTLPVPCLAPHTLLQHHIHLPS